MGHDNRLSLVTGLGDVLERDSSDWGVEILYGVGEFETEIGGIEWGCVRGVVVRDLGDRNVEDLIVDDCWECLCAQSQQNHTKSNSKEGADVGCEHVSALVGEWNGSSEQVNFFDSLAKRLSHFFRHPHNSKYIL